MHKRTITVNGPDYMMEVKLVGSWQEGVRAFDDNDREIFYAAGVTVRRRETRGYMLESVAPGTDLQVMAEVAARLPYAMRMAEDGEWSK